MGLIKKLIKAGIEAAAGDPTPAEGANSTQQPYSSTQAQAKVPLTSAAATDQQPTSWSASDPETGGYSQGLGTSAAPKPAPYKPPGGLRKRLLVFSMLGNAQARHRHSLGAFTTWGVTLLIIGIVFLCLVVTGTYPTKVEYQKLMGIYDEYLAKYCIYIISAIIGLAGASMGRRALRSASSTTPAIWMIVTAVLGALASIGLTIYLLVKSITNASKYNIPDPAWWTYLIDAIIIIERILFILSGISAVRALKEAENDKEVAATMVASPVTFWK